uniref:Uncharacterized protein n=1 Tax=viral metagenome TaxID=1070528 RepID=A0A6C0ELK2_9ZZZZ
MSDPRRIMHPHAVSSFTRRERKNHPNMYPEGHVHMDDKYHKDTRTYNKWKRSTKKTGGRRPRKTRRHHTRRR